MFAIHFPYWSSGSGSSKSCLETLSARLFGVGVRYLKAKDERVLLDLLQEERAILRDLFGLAE